MKKLAKMVIKTTLASFSSLHATYTNSVLYRILPKSGQYNLKMPQNGYRRTFASYKFSRLGQPLTAFSAFLPMSNLFFHQRVAGAAASARILLQNALVHQVLDITGRRIMRAFR